MAAEREGRESKQRERGEERKEIPWKFVWCIPDLPRKGAALSSRRFSLSLFFFLSRSPVSLISFISCG